MLRPTGSLLLILLQLLQQLPRYETRLAGFHIDMETCDGDMNDGQNRSAELALCATFFGTLANVSATLKQANALLPHGTKPFILSVDSGTSWSCPEDDGSTACYNVVFQGKNKSVAAHVVDLADEVVLMDYDNNATAVVSRAQRYLKYADSQHRRSVVRVGLALAGYNETVLGWMTANETALEDMMNAIQAPLSRHPSFGGFAVFTDAADPEPWRDQSVRHPAPHGTHFIPAAQWYVDHTMVLNTTKRAAWLRWAKTRYVNSVWIAPHATNVDLIEIPGVEGSHADDVAFCDFIQEADAQGLDVQLFATPMSLIGKGADEIDLRFAINCTLRHAGAQEVWL